MGTKIIDFCNAVCREKKTGGGRGERKNNQNLPNFNHPSSFSIIVGCQGNKVLPPKYDL